MSSVLLDSSVDCHRSDVDCLTQLRKELNAILKGKPDVIELVLVCLLSRGHLLIEDKPGLGKTTLAKGLADALGGRFARLQCTPDLLPSDITGFNLFNQKNHEFEFREGPVFSDILLADEINRATPRTQSALLEAMAERQVTVDGARYGLPDEFFVMATQNPTEQLGTYPLPEAQLDRFAMKLSIGYPQMDDELRLLQSALADGDSRGRIKCLFSSGQLASMQKDVTKIHVAEKVQRYLIQVAQKTRQHPRIVLGVSPRGLLIWQRCLQARAYLEQRDFVTIDDAQSLAIPVLGVRLGLDDVSPEFVLEEILHQVAVPE
ncbi:AAA family ATPase [Lacunimicrobium album]